MPEAPTAPPPTTSTPPSSPQSATSQAAGPSPSPASNLNNAFADLERLIGQPDPSPKATPKQAPKPPASDATPKQPTPDGGTSTDDSGAAEPASTNQDTPPPSEPPRIKARDLKEKALWAERDAKEWKGKYEKLFAESQKPKDDPEKKSLAERLESVTKERDQFHEALKYKAYEETPEYKAKWHQPFIDAYTAGRQKVAGLKIRDGHVVDAQGQVLQEGTWRQATAADFDKLMSFNDDGEAAEWATQVFGAKAGIALFHQQRAQELNQARLKAIDEYRTKGSEMEKANGEQLKAIQKQVVETWESENRSAAEKYPQWFKPEDGDEKGNMLLERGFRDADMAFGDTSKMSPTERAKLHSAIRNKAGGFDRLAYKLTLANKELKELRSKLEEYEKSEPHGGDTRREGTTSATPDNIDAVLGTLDKYVKPIR